MTTSIKVSAHCATDKEVTIVVDDEVTILQDGEEFETFVYDERCCSVQEVQKVETAESPDASPESGGTHGDRPPRDND